MGRKSRLYMLINDKDEVVIYFHAKSKKDAISWCYDNFTEEGLHELLLLRVEILKMSDLIWESVFDELPETEER